MFFDPVVLFKEGEDHVRGVVWCGIDLYQELGGGGGEGSASSTISK